MLKTALIDVISPNEIANLYSSFDVIGNIAIIKVPDCLADRKFIIGESILKRIKSIRSVFAQTSPIKGDYRIRDLELIAGEATTVAQYKEHGCTFKVDIQRTYFSPRLSTERLRIAKMVDCNEIVTNMFGGIGTFSVIIAKFHRNCKVFSIDLNPVATDLCIINSKLNHVDGRVIPIWGDAKTIIKQKIQAESDRVLMPFPEKAKAYVDSAVLALKRGRGIIHFFAHIKAATKKSAIDVGLIETRDAFSNYQIEPLSVRVVREVGPRMYQVVTDVEVFS